MQPGVRPGGGVPRPRLDLYRIQQIGSSHAQHQQKNVRNMALQINDV